MKTPLMAAFGWIVPGGTYLLIRRYLQAAIFAALVTAAFAGGLALHGATGWPQPAELSGLDGGTALLVKAGALGKALAGAPYVLATLFGGPDSFLSGRLHEYGSTLLIMAGACNVLAISSALDLRKEESQR